MNETNKEKKLNKEITYNEAIEFIANCEHTAMLNVISQRAKSRLSYIEYCKTKK